MKIFTLNTWMLPFNLSKYNKKRFSKILDFIKKEEPDIVALQEVWFSKYVEILDQLDYNMFSQSKKYLNRSGLVTMTKKKHKAEFVIFPKYNSPLLHKPAKRGFHKLKVGEIYFFNAHLYIMPGKESTFIAKKELEIIKKHMKGKCILCGDMNIDKKEFNKINNSYFSYAENSRNTFSSKNPLLKKWWDPKMVSDKKIDYILVKNPSEFSFKSKVIKEGLSDHYGILAEIKFKS
jgi:endonuclease/exonuclease/phosphatase family metal-dependent hydrolase